MVSNLTPAQIMSTLSTIGREIDETTQELSEVDAKVVRLKHAYEMSRAKTFLDSEGSMEIRKYTAILATGDASYALECAEQEMRAVTLRLRALRDRLEIGRSMGPLMRLEWGQA